jgi:hypothetical protein
VQQVTTLLVRDVAIILPLLPGAPQASTAQRAHDTHTHDTHPMDSGETHAWQRVSCLFRWTTFGLIGAEAPRKHLPRISEC